jgi:hypothetical protein
LDIAAQLAGFAIAIALGVGVGLVVDDSVIATVHVGGAHRLIRDRRDPVGRSRVGVDRAATDDRGETRRRARLCDRATSR